MTVTRFVAVKFKDEHAGTDEKATRTREETYNKHLQMYKSRPYISEVQGSFAPGPGSHGYHYAFVVTFESEEMIDYYSNKDPDHLKAKESGMALIESMFVWAFPPKN